jgi:hypothetical protein
MKMVATKDFLHPFDSVIHVTGTKFDLEGDDSLCEYLVGMGVLEYAEDEPTPEPIPAKSTKPAPTKAELSSGVTNG